MNIPLITLVGQIIELTLQYPMGHATFLGRVRLIQDEDLWVGPAVFPKNVEARVRDKVDAGVEYVVHVAD